MTKPKPYLPKRLTARDYARAEQFLPWHLVKKFRNADVKARWSADGGRFVYRRQTSEGWGWIEVDARTGSRKAAFDHVRAARLLGKQLGRRCASKRLPIDDVRLLPDGRLAIGSAGRRWVADATFTRLDADSAAPPGSGELLSPDGRWALFRRGHDLWLRPTSAGAERPLTSDGATGWAYAVSPESNCITVAARLDERAQLPVALWSPDSRTVLTHRLDERKVRIVSLVQHASRDGPPDPVVHQYRMAFCGDDELPKAELLFIDVETGARRPVRAEPYLASMISPIEQEFVWWGPRGDRVYAIRRARSEVSLQLEEIDVASGKVRPILVETGPTYVEASSIFWGKSVAVLESADEVIWFSERTKWGHLYLYDLKSGALKRTLTGGAWTVIDLIRVDEESRFAYFTACGREVGRDPYFRHLYRVGLDGGAVELLTPEDADHTIVKPKGPLFVNITSGRPDPTLSGFAPGGSHFIDTHSTAVSAPRSFLRDQSGKAIATLEECETGDLMRAGWRWPERVVAKGRDGKTPIHGLVFVPSRFDRRRKYPVIDLHYPGPHCIKVPKSSLTSEALGMWWYAEGRYWAELGFVAVMFDGMGTPFRGKAFHDVSYRNIHDCGTPDRIAAIREVAASRPWMDLDRVGIVGHSGGGFGAARALFDHGDFYKAGVSSAGSHDLRAYANAFGEQFMGPFDPALYARASNVSVAHKLQGKLLLCVGDMDENTHPALTLAVANALIRAGRDFELMVYPNGDHLVLGTGYYLRRQWDFMVRHLLGAEPPAEYDLWGPRSGKPERKPRP